MIILLSPKVIEAKPRASVERLIDTPHGSFVSEVVPVDDIVLEKKPSETSETREHPIDRTLTDTIAQMKVELEEVSQWHQYIVLTLYLTLFSLRNRWMSCRYRTMPIGNVSSMRSFVDAQRHIRTQIDRLFFIGNGEMEMKGEE
jgi:hypothetical protein